jgi:Fur family transcriptional regulator, ferric uptake regulator
MSSIKDTFCGLLKSSGNSVTKARLAVFDSLVGQEPISMAELVKRAGRIDRASVYRAVELFEQLHIVQRVNFGWKYKIELSDKFTAHHHHATCTNCERTVAMNEQMLEHFIDQLARQYGFAPTAHQIEIQGLCKDCQLVDGEGG